MTRNRIWAALIAAVLAVFGIGFLVGDTDNDGRPDTVTITTPRAPAPAPTGTPALPAPAGDLEAPADDNAARGIDPANSELRDETPPDVPDQQLEQGDQAADKAAEQLPDEPLPLGGAQNYTCRRDFSGGVYSTRGDSPVMQFVLHYTVSPNLAGWSDIEGVQGYFKRTRVGSSTFIVDFEGHCLQMVPHDNAPWTQGAFNRVSESVEIIATGRETRDQWLASPLIKGKVLSELIRDRLRARGLPLRRVDPSGCVAQLGVTDHNALECGNDHTDVAPAFPWDVFLRQLNDGPKPVTRTDISTCRKLNWWRRADRPGGKARANAIRRRKALEARDVKCTARGPVRTG